MPSPFSGPPALEQDVASAIVWRSERSAEKATWEREHIVRILENEAARLWYAFCICVRVLGSAFVRRLRTGMKEFVRKGRARRRMISPMCLLYFVGLHVRRRFYVSCQDSATVCGPLLERLVHITGHADVEVAELFRQGVRTHGHLCWA